MIRKLLICLMPWMICPLAAQSGISSLQYYWNNGTWSEATTIILSSGQNVEEQVVADLAQAELGINHLHLRVLTQEGTSSHPFSLLYYQIPNAVASLVVAAEYFWDNDPGPGQGNALAVTPSTTLDELTSLSLQDLASGSHFLGIRVRSESGIWSLPVWKQVFRMPAMDDIVALGWHFTGTTAPPEHSSLPLPQGPGSAVDDSLSIPLHQLVEGQSYLLHVYALNSSGVRSHEVLLPLTPDWTPKHPVLCYEDGSILLSWDPVLGAESYQVLASSSPDGPFSLSANPTAISYSEAPSEKRFFRVKAIR